jgi:hypothetical protein
VSNKVVTLMTSDHCQPDSAKKVHFFQQAIGMPATLYNSSRGVVPTYQPTLSVSPSRLLAWGPSTATTTPCLAVMAFPPLSTTRVATSPGVPGWTCEHAVV